MERRKFARAFKVEAVRLVRERGVTVAQAARDLGVQGTVLRRWVQEWAADAQQAFPGQGQMKADQLEIERLRREVTKLKAERDILKKPRPTSPRSRSEVRLPREAPGELADGVVMRGARCLAGWVLGVADAATQPACSSRRGVGRQDPDEFPAVRPDLRRETSVARPAGRGGGVRPASDRATDAAQALRARPRRRRVSADAGPPSPGVVSPNVLNRQFDAPAPNRKWVADFTYLWTAEGRLYVAAVVDLFSRRVVGWSMQATMTAQLVTDALVMTIWRRGKPEAVLHHSDRGSQYTSEPFQRLLADQGLACRMSRSGNC